MALWDDFWESFLGLFGAGAAGAAAGGVAGYAVGSLAGDAAAKAGASFGASLGAQMFSGWQKQDVPYGGLREGPPLTAEQQRQVTQMQAGRGDVALMITGEVVPGSMVELDSTEQSSATRQEAVTPEQAKDLLMVPSPEQVEQAFYAGFDPAGSREFEESLRTQLSEGYLADWAYTKTGTKEPPRGLRDGPPPIGEDAPRVGPPAARVAAPTGGPTLLERLQGLYGGEYTVSDAAPPTIDDVVSYGGESPDPSTGSTYQGGPAGSSTRVLPSSAGAGPDAYMYLGPYGPFPADVVLDPLGTAEGLVRGVVGWVEPYVPRRGTWQRGVLSGAATFVWGSHPIGQVLGFFSSAYGLLEKWEGESKDSAAYVGDMVDWWSSHANPLHGLATLVAGGVEAAGENDDEGVARTGTQLLLILLAMMAGGRAGGGSGAGPKGGKPPNTASRRAGSVSGEVAAGAEGGSGSSMALVDLPSWAKPTPAAKASSPGVLIETSSKPTAGTFKPSERAVVDFLVYEEGRTVESIPESSAGRTADALVDGVPWEFKSPEPGASHNTIKNQINKSKADAGQARNILIFARGTGLSLVNAIRGVGRVRLLTNGKLDTVRIVGDTFDITFTDFK